MGDATITTGRAMEKLDQTSPTGRVNVPAPKAWIERLDEWRAQQRPVLTKAEAVRQLVTEALDVREKAQGKE
jgi:hypothetical protein